MSSKFFGNKTVKQSETKKGSKSVYKNQNNSNKAAVRKTGRGKQTLNTNISLKQINKLAIPAIIAGISEPILSLTDAAIVGHMSDHATESLAAVGIVTAFLSMLIWVLGQSRSAISSIISQYVGANKLNEVKALPSQAIAIILIIATIICFITYPLSKSIFSLYNASDI